MKSSRISKRSRLLTQLRENLFLGLITLTPLAVTLWILSSIVGSLDGLMLKLVPEALAPRNLLGFNVPGLGIVFTFVLLLIAGTAARTVWGKVVEKLSESVFSRIPFVGGLYKTARQVSNVFFSSDSTQAFKKVVYVPFPAAPARVLAFVTGHPDTKHTAVFVPTAPNPTGGYVVIYPNESVDEVNISVESALKIILSCGAVSVETPPPGSAERSS